MIKSEFIAFCRRIKKASFYLSADFSGTAESLGRNEIERDRPWAGGTHEQFKLEE